MALTPGSPEWEERLDSMLMAEAAVGEPSWWWMSFADPHRPTGQQFLGVAIVRASGEASAVTESHQLGVNPGGEIALAPIPEDHVPPPHLRNRLLSRAELEEAGLA